MTKIHRTVARTLLIVPIASAIFIAPALSADRSDKHAVALSHRYGAYAKGGNLAAGQTAVIDTPEGSITCTGGLNRGFTGIHGNEGYVKPDQIGRTCHFN